MDLIHVRSSTKSTETERSNGVIFSRVLDCETSATMDRESLEIKKLKAINFVNLEIWNRLQTYNTEQVSNPRRNQFFDQFTEENANNGHCSNTPVVLNCECIQSVSFSSNCLQLTKAITQILVESFSVWFPKKINFFNDALPQHQYFDLSDVIDKYEFLDQKKSVVIIASWKKALEDVQQYLGSLETKYFDLLSNTQEIEKIFRIPKSQPPNLNSNQTKVYGTYRYKQQQQHQQFSFKPKSNVSLSFSIPCEKSKVKNMEMFSTLLYDNYECVQCIY